MKTKFTQSMARTGVALLALLAAPAVFATATLELSSGTDTVTVQDGDALDSSALEGVVTYVGPVGPFTINVTTGISKPVLGQVASPKMDLNSVDTSQAGGTLTLRFSDNDFAPAPPGEVIGAVGGTVARGGNVQFNVYVASSNVPLDVSEGAVLSHGPFPNGAFDNSASSSVTVTAPYSLTIEAIITHPVSANGIATSFDYALCTATAMACPPDITVQCESNVPAAATTLAEFIAQGGNVTSCNCTDFTLSHEDVKNGNSCSGVFTRTYSITDCQGTVLTCAQKITYEDVIPPEFTFCPPDLDLGCDPPSIPDCDVDQVEATDDCGRWKVTCSRADSVTGNVHTRTLTYVVEDRCKNQATCTQKIRWTEDCAELCPHEADYWKRHPHAWPAGYTPDQTVQDVFSEADRYRDAADKSLWKALGGDAGDDEVADLLQEAVAALLNAADPAIKYPFTEDEIIMAANKELRKGDDDDLEDLAELLEDANEIDKDCVTPPVPTCPRSAYDWKKIPAGWPAPYAWNQTVVSVFAQAALYPEVADRTLLESLHVERGSAEVYYLVREGIAALLNVATPGVQYPWTTDEIIQAVNEAMVDGRRSVQKDWKFRFKYASEDDKDCLELPPPACPKTAKHWKETPELWPAAFAMDQTVESVFDQASKYSRAADKTLWQAICGKAGSDEVKDLLEQAVAALLNAGDPSIIYPYTTDQIIRAVNQELKRGDDDDLDDLADLLEDANEDDDACKELPKLRCPKTPSDWEDHKDKWPAAYPWDELVGNVFTQAALYPRAANKTLYRAIKGDAGSGEVQDLLEEAVAALLNAASPGIAYPITEAQVIDAVNVALTSGDDDDLEDLEDLFDDANENDDDCDD